MTMVIRRTPTWLTCGLLASLSFPVLCRSAAPEGKNSPDITLYAPDPNDPWNRTHAAFMTRRGPDGLYYGEDRLEPLLWTESTRLQEGDDADRAVGVLENLLREGSDLDSRPAIHRAVLQRDLWLVANWLEGRADTETSRKLQTPLARAIGRLALTKEQIGRLVDSYQVAASSGTFAAEFDPLRPEDAYLPPDLFDPEGPWVSLGMPEGPTAPRHLADGDNRFTNSAFLVFLKLPGGRTATLDFLARLAELKPSLTRNTDGRTNSEFMYALPEDAPAWPRGTEVALARRALLIDSNSRVVASPITESIQLRVITIDTPAPAEILKSPAIGTRNSKGWHVAFEFQWRRSDWFAGERGRPRDMSGEQDFKTGFNSHAWDVFETADASDPFPASALPFPRLRDSCVACHNYPGVYSFNSFVGLVPPARLLDDEQAETWRSRFQAPRAASIADVEQRAIEWKQSQPAWKALQRRFGP